MPTDDQLYEHVVASGHRMRRRRTAALGAGAAATLVAVAFAVAGLADRGDDGNREAVEADGAGTTTSTTGTLPPASDGVDTPDPATTAAPPGCRNSRDPACGSFRWDPVPVNEPVTFTISVSPEHPEAGEPLTLTVVAHDREAEIIELGSASHPSCGPDWDDGGVYPPGCSVSMGGRREDPPRTGPWDPPPPVGATATATFEHTYDEPGTYTVKVYALTVTSEAVLATDYDVYGGAGSDTVTITVG